MAAYMDRDTGHEGISTSTFYGTRKREVASVVLPPDGSSDSDEDEGTSEDEEDELYTEGQCQDSSSSSSDDEAEEGANHSKRGRMFRWRKTKFEHQSTATPSCFTTPDELSTPLTYFSKFFDEDIFGTIAHQTNLYSCQLIGSSINTDASEIKAFIGMKLMMGVVKMPAVENYWATDTRYDKVADVMPLKRSLGTIRKNRLMGCTLEEDRDLLRRGRGSFDFRVDNDAKLAVVKWADNKTVTLVSSCASVSPVGQVRRYSKEEKKKISVPCPKIVSEYNTHMGGVDLADMMIALYRTPAKSHRWYLAIFWQMVDIAVNNAWLLHRRDAAQLGQKHHCLKVFRLDVAKGLIYPEKQKRGRPSKGNEDNTPPRVIKQPKVPRPVDDMIYDRIDHFPIVSVKGRYRMCQDGQTSIVCQKCKVRLCIVTGQNPRNCFHSFHCQ
uniref:PiggyBac transposable element-derived protein domain-containing protein n=1 Tax=Knipowitschia caucasica TaxID=637954 RepID=A0AAV2IYF0_KNICA